MTDWHLSRPEEKMMCQHQVKTISKTEFNSFKVKLYMLCS